MLHKLINSFSVKIILSNLILITLLASCIHKKGEQKEEQISIIGSSATNVTDTLNSIQGNVSLNQIVTNPNSVILTGLPEHRLVTVYKSKKNGEPRSVTESYSRYSSYSYNDYGDESEEQEHYMPGIDILYGYNLLNIAHYDLKTEKLNFLFNSPSLIKTLYYPCFTQDSLNKKPINRNYFLVSVYDEDTNKDTLINKKDLRRFYCFDSTCTVKTQLIPANYSVTESQYDSQNDVMYIFAKLDLNNNGTIDKKEPIHIFWISLVAPTVAKRMY